MLDMTTAWGVFLVTAQETRLLAPYADEPLEAQIIARLLQPGMTFVDVGANRGWYALLASARVGATGYVIACEPDPRMQARLRSLINANGLQRIVRIAPVALGAQVQTRALIVAKEPSLSHVARKTLTDERHWPQFDVETINIRTLCARYQLGQIDVIKIDVEGLELEVLDSLISHVPSLPEPPIVMFEYEPTHWQRSNAYLRDARQWLSSRYALYAVDHRTGGLIRFTGDSKDRRVGRNIFAFPRERTHIADELFFDPELTALEDIRQPDASAPTADRPG